MIHHLVTTVLCRAHELYSTLGGQFQQLVAILHRRGHNRAILAIWLVSGRLGVRELRIQCRDQALCRQMHQINAISIL